MKNMIKKDVKLAFCECFLLMIIYLLFYLVLIVLFTKDYLKTNQFKQVMETLVSNGGAIVMLLVGGVIIGRLFIVERENNVNQFIMAVGINPQNIVFSKIIATFIISYIEAVVLFVFIEGYCFFANGIFIPFGGAVLIKYFLVYPLLVFTVMTINAFIIWISRQGSILPFVATMLPAYAFMLVTFMEMTGTIKFNGMFILVEAIVAIIVSFLVIYLIKKVPKEYIVNIETK
ncbi:MAG: ABC transporter permease [Lachnospiraceae bacterium]|nr:ABC transporter permease [Lachnospiraceae bacterium]